MLGSFVESQPIAYKIITNSIKNNCCSHAYLINTNGYNKGFEFAKAFAKYILCPEHHIDSVEENGCNVCYMIDKESFPELEIINADGIWIKKEQTDKLQNNFSKKSINSNKKVYIINGAHNLNISASNSILKFLEEPEDNIVAILVTDCIYNVLDTIVSRCQILNLNNNFVLSSNMISNIKNNLDNDYDELKFEKIKYIVDFINYLEKNKYELLIYIDDMWNQYFSSKDDFMFALDIMIMFYTDIINMKLKKDIILNDYSFVIEKYNHLSVSDVSRRLKIIIDAKKNLYSNINLGLMMDKLVIEIGRL